MFMFALVTPSNREVIEVKHFRVSQDGRAWALIVTAEPPAMQWLPVENLTIISNT